MRRPRTGTLIGLLAAGALVAPAAAVAQSGCGGLLQPACPAPAPPVPTPEPAPAPGPVAVTITLSKPSRSVDAGSPERITLEGQVRGLPDPGAASVDIEATAPSYGNQPLRFTVSRVTLDDRGRFAISVLAAVTTNVRAVMNAPGPGVGASPVRTIEVRDNGRLILEAVSSTRARWSVSFKAPVRVRLIGRENTRPRRGAARRVHLYALAPGGKVAHRIATAKLSGLDCDRSCRVRAAGTFRLGPRVRRARRFFACAAKPIFLGIGLQEPQPACGRATLR